MSHRHDDKITVQHNDEEKTVYNCVKVKCPSIAHGGEPLESLQYEVVVGESESTPEYITKWLNRELGNEFGIDASEFGIGIIDVDSDDVETL